MLSEQSFVSNDLLLSPLSNTQLVYGPNCAGKSTFLRQIGVICVLAQIGSYVPATVNNPLCYLLYDV